MYLAFTTLRDREKKRTSLTRQELLKEAPRDKAAVGTSQKW